MILNIIGSRLKIELEWYEKLWAFRFQDLEIDLQHIERVSTEKPLSSWTEIRAPGTAIPGVIKAGTYYTNRGKEFWYVTQDKNYLILELRNEEYKRVILNVEDGEGWRERIEQC